MLSFCSCRSKASGNGRPVGSTQVASSAGRGMTSAGAAAAWGGDGGSFLTCTAGLTGARGVYPAERARARGRCPSPPSRRVSGSAGLFISTNATGMTWRSLECCAAGRSKSSALTISINSTCSTMDSNMASAKRSFVFLARGERPGARSSVTWWLGFKPWRAVRLRNARPGRQTTAAAAWGIRACPRNPRPGNSSPPASTPLPLRPRPGRF